LDQAGPQPAQAPVQEPGLLEQAGSLWTELRGLAHDQFQLLALELRQAGSRVAFIVALAILAVVLLGTAWLGALAAAVFWMVDAGLSLGVALMVVVGANLAGAAGCIFLLYRQSRQIPFAATLRSIRGRQ
jgi:uncharacterized membrane protein YqjE